MIAAEETATRPSALLYDSYAEIETEQGNQAWNEGQHHRATKLWRSAARWSQFAAKAARDGAL